MSLIKDCSPKIPLAILLFYTLSVSMGMMNKYILGKTHYGFPFPLLLTGTHSLIHFVLAAGILSFYDSKDLPKISWKKYFGSYVPCGMAAGIDIGLSNYSLESSTLSFYTMVKSSVPIFVLMFAFLFKLETPTLKLASIILVIGIGVLLTAWSETVFDLKGFIIILIASMMSGLRWSLTQLLMEKKGSTPLTTIYRLSPVVMCTLLICSVLIEGIPSMLKSEFLRGRALVESVGIMTSGGVVAFCLVLSEFNLIYITSVVSLSVCGIFKEIIIILFAMAAFGDRLIPINWLGLVISLFGISLYNWERYRKRTSFQRLEEPEATDKSDQKTDEIPLSTFEETDFHF